MIKKIPDTRSVIDKISKHPVISSFIICLISHFMFFGYIESNVLPVAAVFDCLIVFIIGMIITHKSGYICYVAIALFTFSISMHCVCNGRVFRYILSR